MRIEARIACLAVALLTASGALAQRPPDRQRPDLCARQGSTERDRAGVFDYYVLSLSWSPGYCTSLNPARSDPQCSRRFAFVLHGLWPQFARGWPQDCQSPDRGFVPRPVAERMRDIMPSDKLIFHAYRKHGTCSGLGVDGYFALARRLFEKVKIPPRFQDLSEERLTIAPDDLVREFLASNPGLTADMIAVYCAGPGERLREVRICFDRDGNFRSCGKNEDQSRLCPAARIYVPPVRSHPSAPPRRDGDLVLPGPRE
jgi:ribonuclease T2